MACSTDDVSPRMNDDSSDMSTHDMPGVPVDMNATTDQGTVVTTDMGQQNTPDQAEDVDQGSTSDVDMNGDEDMADMGSSPVDMTTDMTDPIDMADPVDMNAPVDMGDSTDMATTMDMGSMSYDDRVQGDCVATSDCGSSDFYCERSAVGGACSGCTNNCDDMPGSGSYQCVFGTCVAECSADSECPPGRFCNTRRGLCQVETCTNDVCPVPWFGCSEPDGICVRLSCDAGEACPTGTQCDGTYCIEDHISTP